MDEEKHAAQSTYGQHDQSAAARRNQWRKDQHPGSGARPGEAGPDPYGEGHFAAGGYGQSGYGGEYGQLAPQQRPETQAAEADLKAARDRAARDGTGSKSSR